MTKDQRKTITLDFHTKANCPLCDRLLELMEPVLAEYRDRYEIQIRFIDIKKNKALFVKFRYRIPVVMHNNVILFEGRPDADQVRSVLAQSFKE